MLTRGTLQRGNAIRRRSTIRSFVAVQYRWMDFEADFFVLVVISKILFAYCMACFGGRLQSEALQRLFTVLKIGGFKGAIDPFSRTVQPANHSF
ncbi:hypothetical protein [Pseudomonas sp. NPDC089396]|uniref:hypothetical protein n=1 Tax=Pseudomonas sp. NPDC089396 TaxID=3364461 RepID=UPI003835FA2C